MIITTFYNIREDGVKLFRSFDVYVDENGEPILDENREPVPTGFKIRKVGTDELYDDAIDIEDAPYEYEETDIKIEEQLEDMQELRTE